MWRKLVKNPNWLEAADQLSINKRRWGIGTRNYRVTNPVFGQDGNWTEDGGFLEFGFGTFNIIDKFSDIAWVIKFIRIIA